MKQIRSLQGTEIYKTQITLVSESWKKLISRNLNLDMEKPIWTLIQNLKTKSDAARARGWGPLAENNNGRSKGQVEEEPIYQ